MENPIWTKFEESVFGERSGAIPNDLKLNLRKLLWESSVAADERGILLLSLSRSLGFRYGEEAGKALAIEAGTAPEALAEAEATAGLMGMLNTYYRFKHMLREGNADAAQEYERAGLRMTVFSRPQLGKEKLELLAFAISVLNGCSDCIVSHEKALRNLNVSAEKIHDYARIAAVLKGVRDL